jgi:hypothetical protein
LKIVIPPRAGHFSTLRLLASLNGKLEDWGAPIAAFASVVSSFF